MSYRSFEDLEVWQRGCRIAVRIYGVLKDCKDYGIKDQMTRAAVSIASNVAEGAEPNSRKVNDIEEFENSLSFCWRPRGADSLSPVESDRG